MLKKPDADRLAALKLDMDAAREAYAEGWAPNTREAYARQWRTFEAWCAQRGLVALPAAPETLALFIASESKRGIKPSSLGIALSAIRHAHEEAGHPSPRDHRTVKRTAAGIRRRVGTRPTQKQALVAQDLRTIVKALPASTIATRDRALLLLGFAGGFRRSELVGLRVEDVIVEPQGLRVLLRRAKTDQEGKGREVGILYGRARATCPVRSLQAWLEVADLREGPIFRAIDKHGNVREPLRPRAVANIIKRRVELAGLDPAKFSGHSLRAGLATSAARAGRTAEVIAKTTGHSTSMVQRYIRSAQLFDGVAAEGLL